MGPCSPSKTEPVPSQACGLACAGPQTHTGLCALQCKHWASHTQGCRVAHTGLTRTAHPGLCALQRTSDAASNFVCVTQRTLAPAQKGAALLSKGFSVSGFPFKNRARAPLGLWAGVLGHTGRTVCTLQRTSMNWVTQAGQCARSSAHQ